MTARDRFTSDLECPRCGRTGTVHLSQEDGWAWLNNSSTTIEDMPDGFRAERKSGVGKLEFDLEFYCIDCNVKVPD